MLTRLFIECAVRSPSARVFFSLHHFPLRHGELMRINRKMYIRGKCLASVQTRFRLVRSQSQPNELHDQVQLVTTTEIHTYKLAIRSSKFLFFRKSI